MKHYFYSKPNRVIEPVLDPILNELARVKIEDLFKTSMNLIPKRFQIERDKVALYNPKGDIERANAIIIESSEGAYDLGNRLNDLTGKQWTKFTCSWFIFNALPKDLKEEREFFPTALDHPATFSPTMIEGFINYFTKTGMKVLDPFSGIGSTLVAAQRTGRIGYGFEINNKYFSVSTDRVPEFKSNIFNDSCEKISQYKLPEIDFCISSPPYWDVLNRSTKSFHETREDRGLDKTYSSDEGDLGNISNYDEFVERTCNVFRDVYKILRPGAYCVIILKNVKKNGKLYPLAWDVARELSKTYEFKDEKIWIQDKVSLAPYGYPYSWVSNILHHYCIVLQKRPEKEVKGEVT